MRNDIEKALEFLKEGRKSYEWQIVNIPKNCTETIESIKDKILIVNTTISALEKQIPKQVEEIERVHERKTGICPTCKSYLMNWENKKVCDCGQKIDWEV